MGTLSPPMFLLSSVTLPRCGRGPPIASSTRHPGDPDARL